MRTLHAILLIVAGPLLACGTTRADDEARPETNRTVRVTGEVAKPGVYPYAPGMTATRAIAAAGGFTVYAHVRVRLFRDSGGFEDLPKDYRLSKGDPKDSVLVDIRKILEHQAPDIRLRPGDWIAVRDRLE